MFESRSSVLEFFNAVFQSGSKIVKCAEFGYRPEADCISPRII